MEINAGRLETNVIKGREALGHVLCILGLRRRFGEKGLVKDEDVGKCK